MNIQRSLLYAFICVNTYILATPIPHYNKEAMHNYVHHYIAGLYGVHDQRSFELKKLAEHVAGIIEKRPTGTRRIWSWTSFRQENIFNAEKVVELVKSGVIEHIAVSAERIAREYTHDSSIIQHIKEEITNEVIRIFADSSRLNGQFKHFLEEKLKEKIWQIKNRLEAQRRIHECVYYPSEQCCSCLESFDDVPRIYLKPCGHDMCSGCVADWFFAKENRSCPHCRSDVSKSELRKSLRGR